MVKSGGSRQTFEKVFLFKRESRSQVARAHWRINPTVLRWEWPEHFWRKERHTEGTNTHRECQGLEYRWGWTFKGEQFSVHILLQHSLWNTWPIYKVTSTIGFIFTNTAFPLSESFFSLWNKFISRKRREI